MRTYNKREQRKASLKETAGNFLAGVGLVGFIYAMTIMAAIIGG